MIRNLLAIAVLALSSLSQDEDMYDSEIDSNGDGIADIIEEIYEEMDPKNLDPGERVIHLSVIKTYFLAFKPDKDDPRNMAFNDYDDWTIQANLERFVNRTFTIHLIELKDIANHVTLGAKMPNIETLFYNSEIKKHTGYDHWKSLEKVVFCKVLINLDPVKVSVFK